MKPLTDYIGEGTEVAVKDLPPQAQALLPPMGEFTISHVEWRMGIPILLYRCPPRERDQGGE